MILCALAWSGEAWGQDPYCYHEESTSEIVLEDGWSTHYDQTRSWNGPAQYLSFSYKFGSAAGGDIEVYAYTDGNCSVGEKKIKTLSKKTSYTSSGDIPLDPSYRSIKIHATSTARKWIHSLKITRATILTPSQSNVSFGKATIGSTLTKDITVAYSNGYKSQTFSVETNSPGFSVTNLGASTITATHSEATGAESISFRVSFTPTAATSYNGTVTLKMKKGTSTTETQSIDLSVSGTGTIAKANPSFTCSLPSTVYTKRTYVDFFSSSNNDPECETSILLSPSDIAQYKDGKISFQKTGSGSITITQNETTHFNLKSQTYYFNVEEAQNHVEFTIDNETKYNTFVVEESNSDRIGYDNGIRLGTTNQIVSVSDHNDKYVIIEFSGIPDKLSFTTTVAQSGLIPSGISFYVQEIDENGVYYSDPEQWTSTEKENTVNKQLQPSTRKLKICYSGNYWAHIKNLTVTERKYLDASVSELDFSTNSKGNNVSPQTFTVSHCNAGSNVSITSNNSNFTVSPSVLNTTGGDLMGTQVITVNYLNNTTGVHNGTITISDPNGTNSPVTINVSGTTQTTYYTRADAETGVGGNAYVSYVSSDDAAANQHTSTSLKSSGLTSEANATNNAYWIAVPEQGYTFVEWQWPNGTQASTNASYKREGYEYNSEDQDNPTVVKFKAIFAPKILTLQPTSSTYTVDYYKTVYLNWTLKSGYSTIALPFNTTVADIVGDGYDEDDDWVAQLSLVTYNAKDGYSLYFEKKSDIVANQPYILHLGSAVDSPVFNNISVVAAATATQYTTKGVHDANQWVLHSNYNPTFDMEGYYGVVGEKIKKGAEGSSLKAYHAYIEGPTAAAVKAAYLDDDEADGLLEVLEGEVLSAESVYDLQGRQLPKVGKGINIIRGADGSFKKILSK